jgi:AAHS family 4-hydroxybenzoate transporter-like MFS transporter
MFCGFNLGMAGGGFISAKLIPAFGWHSLLLIGGVLPLILALVLLVWLPESARFLVVRNRGTDKVRKTLSPIAPHVVAEAGSFSVPEQKPWARNVFAVIFSGTYSRHRAAVADLLHGPGDRLPADQLAADPDA